MKVKQSIVLDIKGMSCASCVNRIEKVLKKNEAVLAVSVNLATEKAKVEFDALKIDPAKIAAIITSAGYEANPVHEGEKDLGKTETLQKEKKLIVFAALLTFPLLFPMLLQPFGFHTMLPAWLQWALATPVQFYVGARFYRLAWSALKAKTGNMELLVAIGTTAAYGLSLYLSFQDQAHLYFESSATVITLVLLGKYLETKAKMQTFAAIKALQQLRPTTARILHDQNELEVSLEQIKIGDLVVIRPGERIPVDGTISRGSTHIDESLVTGENLPLAKSESDPVIGGSINAEGTIFVKVTAIGKETMLSKIIRMIEEAQAVKAPIQKLVDKVSAYFVPTVLVISALTVIMTVFLQGSWEHALINGVAVLVIACPCALGLATPTSIMVGTGVAAKAGILIKDAQALELTHGLTVVVFDKTGTLTEGRPSLKKFYNYEVSEEKAFSILASIQKGSEHPLAKAVVSEAMKRNIAFGHAEESQALPGRGLEAIVEGTRYIIGSKRLLSEMGINTPNILALAQEREALGETVSYLIEVNTKKILAMATFSDTIKPSARATIEQLKILGIKSVMLSGDNYGSAKAVAKELGIDEVHAEVLPQHKAELIQQLRQKGEAVGMVGDGINDAPALAAAHVGIAMATGTDVAMHTASITLMRGNPLLIPDAISISKRTYAKIKQNLFWAFIYNIIGIPLAALGYLNPMVAGTAMAMSSVSVVTNSLLLRRWKPVK